MTHDDVIKHVELKKLSCADKVTRYSNVRIRWGSVTAGVIVHQHNSGGGGNDCEAKHFTRRNKYRIECAD